MVFIKQRARTSFAKTSGSAVPHLGTWLGPPGRKPFDEHRAPESRHRTRPDLQRFRVPHLGTWLGPPGRKPFDEHRALQSRHRTRPDLRRLQVPFLNAGTRKLPHNGTDPEARPTAFWRKVRDSGAGKWK